MWAATLIPLLLLLSSSVDANFGNFGWRRTEPKEKHSVFCSQSDQVEYLEVKRGGVVPLKSLLATYDEKKGYRVYK